MTSGSRSCFRSLTWKVTLDRLPAEVGVGRAGADLGLGLARLARLDARPALRRRRGPMPSWNRSSGWRRNWISLTSLSVSPVAVEAQVGRDEVAELGAPFELGHDLGVPFEEPLELRVDVGLGDRLDRPLDRQRLVLRQGELGPDLDVHLEPHRALVGQLDGLDVEVGLGDRVELVVLVELLQGRHQQRRLDLLGDLLAEPLLDKLPRGVPGPEAGHGRLALHRSERLVELAIDLGAAIATLRCFLHGPTSVIWTSRSSFRLRPRSTSPFGLRSISAVLTGESRSCSPVLIGRPSSRQSSG